VRYSKPAESIAEQINRLIRRGMAVPDHDRAAHYLYHLNYYRLRGYWIPFEDKSAGGNDHKFSDGTTFEQALNRYIFDRELRLLVMDAIERIEVSVRTQWAYHLSHAHGSHAHLNGSLFSKRDYHACLRSLVHEVGRSREDFITHFKETYDEDLPPIWAVVEVMSLGQLSRWYENVKSQDLRQRIATVYEMDEKVLVSLLHHLTLIRNFCAHHSRLWNRRFTITPKLPRRNPAKLAAFFNPVAPRQIYNAVVMIAYLMNIISPGHHWKHRLLALLSRHDHIPTEPMGFPDGWENMDFWKVSSGKIDKGKDPV